VRRLPLAVELLCNVLSQLQNTTHSPGEPAGERGFQFAISENENLVAVAPENRVLGYAGGKMLRDIETGLPHARAVTWS
jgi:hypothetical protein